MWVRVKLGVKKWMFVSTYGLGSKKKKKKKGMRRKNDFGVS